MGKKNNPKETFESQPGKPVTMIKLGGIVIKTETCETSPCELPIDEWRSIPLEIPSQGFKTHLLGRFPGGMGNNSLEADSEIINVPIYTGEDIGDTQVFERLGSSDKSNSQTKIPVVTVTTKSCGRHSDGRQIQSVNVLPVWNDGTSMVLELDWSEGDSVEDAVNPEWYVRASPRLPVIDGLQRLKECSKLHPLAEECSYYLYINPSSIGKNVLGEGHEYPSKVWQREWKFSNRMEMIESLVKLSETIAKISK
jgi:hypothetical protein